MYIADIPTSAYMIFINISTRNISGTKLMLNIARPQFKPPIIRRISAIRSTTFNLFILYLPFYCLLQMLLLLLLEWGLSVVFLLLCLCSPVCSCYHFILLLSGEYIIFKFYYTTSSIIEYNKTIWFKLSLNILKNNLEFY